MIDKEKQKKELMQFLSSIIKSNAVIFTLDENMDLIKCGLIDSLAILEIITYLEKKYKIYFKDTGFYPEEISSINGILKIIEEKGS